MTPEQYPDSVALTIAQEVTANEFIAGPLPGSPVLLAQFPELPKFESTDVRYARLRNAERRSTPRTSCQIEAAHVGELVWQTLLAGDLHSALAGLPEDLRARALAHLGELARANAGLGTAARLHALPDADRTRADWRSILRRFVWSLTQPNASRRQPSRRFPQLVGIVPGRASIPHRPRLLAVIDTSGSMIDEGTLATIRTEIQELGGLADLLIVECDTEIKRVYKFTGNIADVVGGGGTSFRAPLSKMFLRSRRVDGVVYFTDGIGSAPRN
jgi:hypothetical protein